MDTASKKLLGTIVTIIGIFCVTGVFICLAGAYSSPWYRISTSNKVIDAEGDTQSSFTWSSILQIDTSYTHQVEVWQYHYWRLLGEQVEADGTYAFMQVVMSVVTLALLCWGLFCTMAWLHVLGLLSPSLESLAARFRIGQLGIVAGLLGTVCMCLGWLVFFFMPVALNSDMPSECFGLDVCDSFAGSNSNGSWGPDAGWIFALMASICAVLALITWASAQLPHILNTSILPITQQS